MLRRVFAAVFVCALSLPTAACGRLVVHPQPLPEVPDRAAGVRLGILFDQTLAVRNEPEANKASAAEVAHAVETGLPIFLTEERPDVWPRQRIVAAVAVRALYSNAEGTDAFCDMVLRRGPGDYMSGFRAPVRIRMIRRNRRLVVVGFDRAGDQHAWWHDSRHLFPEWVRPRLNDLDDPLLVTELDRIDRAFVLRSTPPPAATSKSSKPSPADDERTERPATRTPRTSQRTSSGEPVSLLSRIGTAVAEAVSSRD